MWARLRASDGSIRCPADECGAFGEREQTYVDTYSKAAHAKLYTTKTPITAADLLNDRVLPLFEKQGLPVLRILTDRGTEYCGRFHKTVMQEFYQVTFRKRLYDSIDALHARS
jgi:hypothetical protein